MGEREDEEMGEIEKLNLPYIPHLPYLPHPSSLHSPSSPSLHPRKSWNQSQKDSFHQLRDLLAVYLELLRSLLGRRNYQQQ